MNLGDLAKIVDGLTKLNPEQMGEQVRQVAAPLMQLASGIKNDLEKLNANIERLCTLLESQQK